MSEWAATFKAVFAEEESEFEACFGEVIEVDHHFDPYPGPYVVIPKAWQDQTLYTENKNMTDDVLVTEVPYTEVSNLHGTTVSIATE